MTHQVKAAANEVDKNVDKAKDAANDVAGTTEKKIDAARDTVDLVCLDSHPFSIPGVWYLHFLGGLHVRNGRCWITQNSGVDICLKAPDIW